MDHVHSVIALIPAVIRAPAVVSPLSGGLTNSNYLIETQDQRYVLRMFGPNTALLGINRETEVACARAAAACGVGPEITAYLPEHQALLRPFLPGQVLTPADLKKPETLQRVVTSLRCYHEESRAAGTFSPFAVVREYHQLARQKGVSFPRTLEHAWRIFHDLERQLATDDPPCPCHNDLLPANFIDDGRRVQIIDWEYGGRGDRFFDLGNLAVNAEFDPAAEEVLLSAYFGAANVTSWHRDRVRLMRLVSDLREAMWGFVQAAVSSLPIDYLAYGTKHLDRFIKAHSAITNCAGADQ